MVVLLAGPLESGITVQWKYSHFQNFWPVWYKDKSQTVKKKGKFHCVLLHTGMSYFHCELHLPISPLHPLLAPGGLSDLVRLASAPWCWHNTCQTPSYSPLTSSQIFLSDFLLLRLCLNLVWVFIWGNIWQESQMIWQGLCCSLQVQDYRAGYMEIQNHLWPFIAQVRD